jgi:hypothetical protein
VPAAGRAIDDLERLAVDNRDRWVSADGPRTQANETANETGAEAGGLTAAGQRRADISRARRFDRSRFVPDETGRALPAAAAARWLYVLGRPGLRQG